jgi:hypothetical protein
MAPSNPLHDPLCQCGSCEEAFDAALKTMEQLLTHQCPAWFIAVTRAQWHVAEMLIELNTNVRPYVGRFELHLADNSFAYGQRIEAMLQRAGFDVLVIEDIVPEGSTIQ